jgi:segregation and condensation protein B
MEESEQKRLAEAALFMSPDAIGLEELMMVMQTEDREVSLKIVGELIAEINARNTGLEIVRLEHNKFRMKVKDSYSRHVSHLAVDTEFSKAALRTLGLIAVKHPVRQSIVVKIIGNKAYDYVKLLAEKGFIRAKKAGNTKILEITPKFESYFGKSIEEIKKLGAT